MKKILVCTGYFYPHVGGHERYVEELFSRLPTDEYEVHVLTIRTGSEARTEKYRGLYIHRLDGWNLLGGTYPLPKPTKEFWQTLRELRSLKFDLINTHTRFFLLTGIGGFCAKAWKVYWAHTEHGTNHPRGQAAVRMIGWLYDHTIGWWIMRSADRLVGVSAAAAAFTRHLGGQKVTVVYNGVDTEFFAPSEKRKSSRVRIVFIGRLIMAKGLQDLIHALSQLASLKWSLTVIGDGPMRQRLEASAAGMSEITFLGTQSASQIRTVLQTSDLCVNPSHAEGLPTAVLEAASCGLPVIATNVGGTKELFPETMHNFLVPANHPVELRNMLHTVLSNGSELPAAGQQLRDYVRERFSWDQIARSFEGQLRVWLQILNY